MYAVLVKVRIDPARHDEAISGLHDSVVPQVKSAPGFVRGTWFGDQEAGYGVVLFQSEEQARSMATTVASAPDDPVQVEEVRVYEVNAEA
jgi:hypothetical protein